MATIEDLSSLGPGSYEIEYPYNGETVYFQLTIGDIDSNASVSFDGYGSGVRQDGRHVDDYLSGYNQNSIDFRFQYGHDGHGSNNQLAAARSFMNDLTRAFNLDPSHSMIMGFSRTGGQSVHTTYKYITEYGVNGTYCVAVEPCFDQWLAPDEITQFIDHDVTIINAYANGINNLSQRNYEGVHMIDFNINITNSPYPVGSENYYWLSHTLIYDILAASGITNIANGNFDFTQLPTEFVGRDGETYQISYNLTEHYRNEEGQYVSRPLTLELANEVVGTNAFTGVKAEDIIQSDNEYLSQGLSLINAFIRTSRVEGIDTLGCSSTTSVPSKEPDLLFKMISSSMNILNKMGQELVSIGKVGNKFSDMDNFLANEADKLNMDINSSLVPEIELKNYESRDIKSIIPEDLLRELEDLKAQIDNNSEENPLVEPEEKSTIREVHPYTVEYLHTKSMFESVCEITAEDLDRLFAHWAEIKHYPDSPLIGMGQYFVDAAAETGLDVMTLVGLCGVETGRGDPKADSWIHNDNFLGLRYTYDKNGKHTFYGGKYHLYTREETMLAGAQRIVKYYYGVWHASSIKGLADVNGWTGASGTGIEYAHLMRESLDYMLSTSDREVVFTDNPNIPAPVVSAGPRTTLSTSNAPVINAPTSQAPRTSITIAPSSSAVQATQTIPANVMVTDPVVNTDPVIAPTNNEPTQIPTNIINDKPNEMVFDDKPNKMVIDPKPVSTTTNSDDSYREKIEEKLKEILPKVSDKKEKTRFTPGKVEYKEISKYTPPAPPVEPPAPPAEPPIEVEPPAPPVEPPIEVEPPIDNPVTPPVEKPTKAKKDNSDMLKTIGITAGIGAGIGTVAYGINNQINKKETTGGYDYSYEREVAPNYYEEESSDEFYNPYTKKEDEESEDDE